MNFKPTIMKNLTIIPSVFLLIFMLSCTKSTITGSGDLTSEFRTVSNFTKVSSEGVFEVTVVQGTSQLVELIADDNIVNKINTKVVDNELRLFLDDDENYRDISLQVNITVQNINSVKNSGAGNFYISNVDNDTEFKIFNSGSGDIRIEGSAQSLSIKNEGSGDIEGFQFVVDNCNVKIIGSGDCKLHCANNLSVDIEGSGYVYYLGTPSIEAAITGSGKIINSN